MLVQADPRTRACLGAAIGVCIGLAFATPSLGAPPAAASTTAQKIDPAAVKALHDMSAYLQTLSTFKLLSQASLDVVNNDGQKLTLDGEGHYTVRKPNAFVIDIVSDSWNRQYVYDGAAFTLYAPKLGFYSSWPAPPTIQATIVDIGERFGISLPLDDLFRWSSPDGARADSLESGFLVGLETIDGVKTNHYAFREGKIDWQIWIQQGDQPLPRKVVIVDRRDPAEPAYTARLTWTLNPPLTNEDFVFRPGPDAKRIRTTLQK
ncbi:MAG: DUF2092 domain-containing protein [Phenylobacterium sp.]